MLFFLPFFLFHRFPARRISPIKLVPTAKIGFRNLSVAEADSLFDFLMMNLPLRRLSRPAFCPRGFLSELHNGFSGAVYGSGMTSDSAAHLARL